MKLFNVTAQAYKNSDTSKQNLLINQIFEEESQEKALASFSIHFPSIEYSLVKILSIEEIK